MIGYKRPWRLEKNEINLFFVCLLFS